MESQWRFLRLRPANFPTVRIAQLAALFSKHTTLFSKILSCKTSQELVRLFQISQSEYWLNHYQLGKLVANKVHGLGKSSIQNLIINTVAPMLVAYGKLHDDQSYIDRALLLLQYSPAENNKIIRQWSELGYNVNTAFDSQGLIELYSNYCTKRRCLECTIGMQIVNKL
jgi:hypothetical protein